MERRNTGRVIHRTLERYNEVNEHNEQKGKNKMLGTKLRDWLMPMDIKDDEIITINGIKFDGFDLNHTRWNSPLMASTIQSVDIDRESGDIEITLYK